ncbi:MAG: hypothetical protein WCA12_12910, partial [Burkholderiales bacterium]
MSSKMIALRGRRELPFTVRAPASGRQEEMMSKYAFGKVVSLSFDEACRRVTEELAKEGFGVLTEIDVAATLKKKIDKT